MINELKYLKTSNEILKNRIYMLNNTINEQRNTIHRLGISGILLFSFGIILGIFFGSFYL